MTHLWTLIPHTIPFFLVRTTARLIPPPDTAGYGSQLLDYCHGAISSGKACHSPELLSAPLSSVGAQPATLNGGRSRQAALRDDGAPDATTALLLRGIPGEAGTEGEGGFARCALLSAMLSPMHALRIAV